MRILLKFWKESAMLVMAVLLFGCGAPYHLRQAEKHLAIAKSKGAKVDSVNKTKKIDVSVKAPESKAEFKNEGITDTAKVNGLLKVNDSLVVELAMAKLKPCQEFKPSASTTESKEVVESLKAELAKTRKALHRQFYKDSTYSFAPDSITSISLTLKQGNMKVAYKRKETTYKDKIEVPVSTSLKISAGYSVLDLGILTLFVSVLAFSIGWFVGKKRLPTQTS